MPRGFSNEEKKSLRQSIIDLASPLFASKGLKATSIDEIVIALNIAKGTFYNLFRDKDNQHFSKGDLYFIIFENEFQRIHNDCYNSFIKSQKSSKERLKELLIMQYQKTSESPIMKVMRNPLEIQYLIQNYPQVIQKFQELNDEFRFLPFIDEWKHQKIVKDLDSSLIIGLLTGLFMIFEHKDNINPQVLPEVLNTYINLIIDHIAYDS